jgi:hypothetical protein
MVLSGVLSPGPKYDASGILAALCSCLCVCLRRLKEFTERWEVDKYLSATGYLPSNVKPFFIALPKV